MGELKTLQNQLLTEVFSTQADGLFDPQGIEVYRANLRATAAQALKITFPTVTQLIGETLMNHAAEALLTINPPNQGDWARWGAGLADLLRDMRELEDYPFVADVAHLDYHCHQLVRDADVGIDFPSLMLLKSHLPEELSITLNPQLTLMQSNFPIAQIRQAHQYQCELRSQALRNALRDKAEYYYLACYRNGLEVLVRSLTELEFNWLTTLQRMTLGDALSAFEHTEFSFQHWLTGAIQTGLLHKIQIHV